MIDADGLAAFLPADPVPVQVSACAAAAFGRRTAGAVPALECLDSVLLPSDAGVRAGAALPRLVGFECETLAVELQIIDEAEGRLIVGQLLPARAGVVHVRHAHGDTVAEADDHGRFQADHIPRGPLGLRIDVRVGDGSATVTTDWIAR
ncbi:MAG: hypothetical protein QOE98_2620 [Gaiellaceae bacterium]|nr:hypothetical protein [Gaiellaceae bacterium]